jgi:predicted MPP superfamily phosphohydrolase
LLNSPSKPTITRRRFLASGACVAGGFALYGGEIERHWLEVSENDVVIPSLPRAFDGFRIAQISDIHMDEFTEAFFVRHVVNRINSLNPDAVFLTGDFVTAEFASKKFAIGAGWQCAGILNQLTCRERYAVLGNHDCLVGADTISEALTDNNIVVLRNYYMPLERSGGRIWLAGLADPLQGSPDPVATIPASICNIPQEPIILLCHAPDYVDDLLTLPCGQVVSLMLCGHTHGGQVRLPLIGPMILPQMGRKYVEGWFRFGRLQLHVNRGIGTVNLPIRFDCPPEISMLTLRSA